MENIIVRQLYDDISKFYPISSTDAIIGGIGQGNNIDTRDFSDLIDTNKFEGAFSIMKLTDNLLWIIADINTKEGTAFKEGDNLITGTSVPLIYIPDTDYVFNSITDGDSRNSFYLGTDGRLHLFIVPNRRDANPQALYDTTYVSGIGLLISQAKSGGE